MTFFSWALAVQFIYILQFSLSAISGTGLSEYSTVTQRDSESFVLILQTELKKSSATFIN